MGCLKICCKCKTNRLGLLLAENENINAKNKRLFCRLLINTTGKNILKGFKQGLQRVSRVCVLPWEEKFLRMG